MQQRKLADERAVIPSQEKSSGQRSVIRAIETTLPKTALYVIAYVRLRNNVRNASLSPH